MDPITSTIMAALTLGVASGATEVGKGIIVDAYQTLKTALIQKCGNESKVARALGDLEQEPNFEPNQSALAGRMAQAKVASDPELLQLTKALIEALNSTPDGLEATTKYKIDAQNIGVVGEHTHIEGGIHFRET